MKIHQDSLMEEYEGEHCLLSMWPVRMQIKRFTHCSENISEVEKNIGDETSISLGSYSAEEIRSK